MSAACSTCILVLISDRRKLNQKAERQDALVCSLLFAGDVHLTEYFDPAMIPTTRPWRRQST